MHFGTGSEQCNLLSEFAFVELDIHTAVAEEYGSLGHNAV
jgi:hypothetical protein